MASVTVDIQARVTGYQASLKELETAFAKVDPGSAIGKKLSTAIESAKKQVAELSRNMFPKASSDTQIDAIAEKVNRVGAALQNVSNMFASLNIGDLNFKALSPDISAAVREMEQLQTAVDSTMNGGIQQAIANSDQLKNAFKSLGADIKSITADNGGDILAKGLATATQEAEKATQAYDRVAAKAQAAQDKLAQIQESAYSSKNFNMEDVMSKFFDISNPERLIDENKLHELQQRFTDALTNFKGKGSANSTAAQELFDSFFNTSNLDTMKTVDSFRTKFEDLCNQLKNLGFTNQGIARLLGTTKGENIFNDIFNLDSSAEEAKTKLNQLMESLFSTFHFNNSQKKTIKDLINKDQFQQAVDEAKRIIEEGYKKIHETEEKAVKTANTTQTQVDAAKGVKDTAEAKRDSLSQATDSYKQIESDLRAKVQTQENRIAVLENTIQQLTQGELGKVLAGAQSAGATAGKQGFPISEAQAYSKELTKINSAQTFVGKLQGVTQRWFSVYAVVRMISRAVKSMINTTKELDKTITNIAIVTDKSQDDLWKQMPKYTEMARKYGASISGAYEVSQLYYQQGLGQEDVMSLTEQTLKMARISGLDYAQATDYMTNAVRSFKLEMSEAGTVVDVYSAIAAKSATSVSELATAMSKTASSAQSVGSSLQNTTAMMAVMIEATRESPENIGSAMKSIISRYGELKENKTGIDEEGEEYSLNKVDKALQTVGISIHDANGEFRDFDDVIFELAEHWDQIDKNTQRYIATVMAGNRQQSRFLALVSSYDRLKELSATAADSEDASQAQFLKTIDSVEYKSQQLQTTIQSLYTNSGIQQLMKDTLDWSNNIIKSFTQMPTMFNLPLPAIAKFGIQFANLAKIVTTTFGLIKTNVAAQIDAIRSKSIASMQLGAAEEVNIVKNKNQQIIFSEQERQEAQMAIMATGNGELAGKTGAAMLLSGTATGKGGKKTSGFAPTRGTALAGLGLSVAGMALTTYASSINARTQEEREGKAAINLLGMTASGAGLGAGFGPIGMAIGGLVGLVAGAIEAQDIAEETAEERAARLKEELQEAQNESIQKKGEYKSLKTSIEEYEKLRDTQLEGEEAAEKYLAKCNELAEAHPEIVDGYDAEGNAIINLTEAYRLLGEARDQASQSGKKSADAAVNAAKDAEAEADVQTKVAAGYKVQAQLAEEAGYTDHKAYGKEVFFNQSVIQAASDRAHLMDESLYAGASNIFFAKNIEELTDALFSEEGQALMQNQNFLAVLDAYENDDVLGPAIKFLKSFYNNVQQQQQELLSQETGFETEEEAKAVGTQKAKSAATMRAYNAGASELVSNQIDAIKLNDKMWTPGAHAYLDNLKNVSSLFTRYIAKKGSEWEGKDYFTNQADADFKEINNAVADFYDRAGIIERQQFDELIPNLGKYTSIEAEEILTNLGFTGDSDPVREALLSYYTSDGVVTTEKLTKSIETVMSVGREKSVENDADKIGSVILNNHGDVLKSLGSSELQQVQKFYNDVLDLVDNQTIDRTQGKEMADAYMQLWEKSNTLTGDKKQKLQDLISESDFTSEEGINQFEEDLKELNISWEEMGFAKGSPFKNLTFPKNFAAKAQTFGDNMTKQLENFDKDLSSVTKGMNLSDATKMADKLGISLTKFRQVGNQFFLDDYELLEEYYFKDRQEQIDALKQEQTEELDRLRQFNTKKSYKIGKEEYNLEELLTAEEYSDEWQNNLDILFDSNSQLIKDLQRAKIDPRIYKTQIEAYMQAKTDKKFSGNFIEYMAENFEDTYNAYVEASGEALKYTMASSYLSAGNIKGFVTAMYGDKFKKQAEEKILGEIEADIEKDTKAALEAEGKTESASALQSQIQQLEDERAEGIVAYNKQMARATGSTISDEQAINALESRGKISAEVQAQQLEDINAQIAALDTLEAATKEQQARDAKKAELLQQRSELEAIISDEENEAQIQANKALNDTLYSQYSTLYGEINDLKSQKDNLRTPQNTLAAMTDVEQQYFAVANSALRGFWNDQTSGTEAWLNSITETLIFEEDGLIGPNNEGFYGEPWDDLDFSKKKAEVLERVKEQGVGFFWDYLKTYNEGFPELDSYDQTMSRAGQALTDQENALQASIDAKTSTMWHLVETMSSIVQTNDAASKKMSDAEKAAQIEDLDAQIAELDRQSAEFDGTKSLEAIAEERQQLIEQKDALLTMDTYDADDIKAEKVELEKAAATTAHKQAQEQLDKQIAELKAKKESSGWSDEEYLLKEAEIREAIRINNQQAIDDEVERLTQELTDTISTSVASGDMSVFSGTLAQFASAARKAYLSTWQSIDNSMITALEQGESYLEVTDANKQALMKMAETYPNLIDLGAAAVTDAEGEVTDLVTGGLVEWKTTTLKSWTDSQWANFISAQGTSDKEKLQMMQNAHKAKYTQDINTISDFVSESDNLTFDNLSTYLNSISDGSGVILDITQDIMDQYGLVEDGFGNYIIKDYDKYIEQLKKDAEKLDVNSKAYQDTMRKIDSADRKHKHQDVTKQVSAFKDVISNYNEVSDDQYSALQEAFGDNWDAVSQILTDTGTGTYKLDVAKLKNSLDELGLDKAVQDAILQMFDDIADDYMKNITDATSMVTKGTTSLSDISKFKEKAAKLGIAAENAFTYDSILQAWTLDPSVLHDYVQAQAQQLVDDGYLSVEEATKYIDDNVTKTLAGAVDIKAFLDAEDKSGKARQTLIQSLKNLGVDERGIPGIIDTLIAGGGNAVSIMQAIAKVAGKELTSSEIESAYRAQVAQLESAVEQLEYGVGSLISGDAIAILQAADYDLAKLDDNNYIIKSIGDISKAYAEYYDKLSKTNEATLAALNEAKAKVEETKDGRYKEQKAIDALGDASGMTYTAFATILTDAGIEMTDEILATYTEALGGNKMRIKDFASFARMMKWDYGSEEYMSAFKTFNDGLIERKDKLKKDMTEELKGLENLKPGDWLNLTYTEKELRKLGKDNSKAIKENKIALQKALKETTSPEAAKAVTDQYQQVIDRLESEDYFTQLQNALAEVGAYFDDGILKLTDDANLIGVVEVLSEKLIAAVEEGAIDIDVGEIQDLMDQILSAYTDAIIKGIKGTLSHADASDLKSKAKDFGIELTDTDFSETTEGLKLSTKAATDLYFQVSRVNALKGKLVFDELNSSLKESDSRFQDLTSIMTYMQGLAKEINELQSAGDGGAGEKRLADAEKELALAKEIAMLRLTGKDEESFKILGKDTLAYSTQNAANYTQDVNTVATKADEWASQGYIPWTDAADFSDFTTHMIDLGDQSGNGVEMFGVQMGGKGGITKTQFQDAISKALTWKTDSKGNPVYALDNEVFQRELQMQIGQGKKGLETTLPAMKDELGAYGDSLRGYDKFFADMDYLSKARKFGEFKEIDDLIGKDGKLHLENTTQQFQDSLLASAENIKIGDKTLREAIEDESANFNDPKYRQALTDLVKLAETTDWELESGYETIKEHVQKYGIGEEIVVGDFTYKMEGDHLLIKDNTTGEYITSDGTKCKSAEEALRYMNEQDIDDLTKELGQYQGKYESSGQANITLDGVEYTITINPSTGKIVLTSSSGDNALDGKEFSDTEEIMKSGYEAYVENELAKRNKENIKQQQTVLSEAAWRLSQRSQDALPAAYTKGGGLSESSRAAFQKAGFNTWKDIQTEWNSMVDKYGQENAALEWEAKYHTRFVPDDSGQMSDDLAKSYMDAINLSQAAADVAAGIDAAFQNEDVRKNIGKAITDGLTESMDAEGTIEIKAPEIIIKPGKITIDTKKVTGELNGEVPTENVNVQGETPTPTTTTTTSTTVVNKTEVIDESATEGTESITIDATLNITNPDLSSEVNPNPVPVDIEFNPQDGSEITPPDGVPDAHGKVVYDESDIQVSNITGPDGHGKINYNSYVIQLPEITGPDGHGKIIYDKSEVTVSAPSGGNEATGNVGLATGNARAAGTLMGELGPELVVQNGRYFVAGQNGAEFVDLANDAIVFNHLQTQRLFKNGMSPDRGKAVTNERVAAAFAHGNWNGGEAKADTSTMGSHYVAPLDGIFYTGVQAGYDAAGKKEEGSGANEAAKEIKNLVKELEKWFNWLQEIAQLEKEITIEEAKRTRYASSMTPMGKEYFTSQVKSLESLKEQLAVQVDLNDARAEYFETVREELNAGAFGVLYEFDENFQPKYKEGMYEAIQDLLYQDPVTGAAKYDAKTQYNRLQAMGLGSLMQYDKSGNKIDTSKDGWESSAVQAFVDKYEAGLEKGQKYHDDLMEGEQKVEELIDAQNQIFKEIEDNQISVEKMVLKAIEDSRQSAIDNSQNERDAIEKSNSKLIDGLNNQLSKEQNMYSQQESADELSKLERQLAIVQRSGGSATQIADLQQQITEKQKDLYFDMQQKQIEALQEASDNELERLDQQIDLMKETLEYQKANGLLYTQVYEVLKGTPEEIVNFIKINTTEYLSKSAAELEKVVREDLFQVDRFKQFATKVEGGLDALVKGMGFEVEEEEVPISTDVGNTSNSVRGMAEKQGIDVAEMERKAREAAAQGAQSAADMEYYTKWYQTDNGEIGVVSVPVKNHDYVQAALDMADKMATVPNIAYADDHYDDLPAVARAMALTEIAGYSNPDISTLTMNKDFYQNHGWSKTHTINPNYESTLGLDQKSWYGMLAYAVAATAEENAQKASSKNITEYYAFGDGFYKIAQGKDGKHEYVPATDEEIKKLGYGGKASGGYVGHGYYELGELGTETVLTAEQTQVLRNNILSNRPDSLINLLKSYNEAYHGLSDSTYDSLITNNGDMVNIERAEVNLQIDKLANDYDSKRAANTIMDEMLRIASKTKANNSVRR